ncbi:dihydropteroate synthase [Acrocarpospora corrugata]|uniref:Dihydropteroate synthase n=1 Tax=Acrocarpospora corrugata TaxID=35763 RepID=A0A5M3W4V7_9ACTN|nr:dihydropteroate synthase [Acrocarpospora corrugata]GES04097.1 dihydropteroate synthase [Acrocarpospora corrugata]
MKLGARTFDFSRQVAVMAIINRTPDSFHDRGRTFALDKAVEAALSAVSDGADWLDIGGVPFGPDGPQVGVTEEIDRVVPLIEAIRAATDAVISVDTHRGTVAEAAIRAGADVVNDTSGVSDPALATAVAAANAGLVVTHSLSGPRVHHPRPTYDDVTAEVVAFLRDRVAFAEQSGVAPDKIIVDPGHDLNKNTLHTLALTRRLPELAALGHPLLVALSNKDFIGETLNRPQHDRLPGSLAAAVFCVLNGARIIRVHDVRASVDAIRMTEALLGWHDPVNLRHNM